MKEGWSIKPYHKVIFLILALMFITQSYAYLTVKYSILEANGIPLSSPYNFTVLVSKENTITNPIVEETPYARFVIYVENKNDEWNLYTNATTINGYSSIKYKAELFNASGEHPAGVDNNPTTVYGDSDGEFWYWGGIPDSDFGSNQTPVKSPIPLGAVILTLIIIPLITLRRMVK
ncbi:hypothetical protein [Methanotorris igneus]|uniref:Uncharacterized protein n=1 Tax=Methanotorris igneus (strain DSM 5666 / JCM 11834 / Kol 5) TaxID=880724 RepID=F6BCZ3_METIK|nr:hypothetical protein [Methanotorris igneus]AEF96354.1 hypothetical protein Metig_0809 [Methanotorris igneus Kol 5]